MLSSPLSVLLLSLVPTHHYLAPRPTTKYDHRRNQNPTLTISMQLPDVGKSMSNFMKTMTGGNSQEELMGLSKEEADQMEDRFKQGQMSFDDFLKQVDIMQKAGSLQSMMSKLPGMNNQAISPEQLDEGQKRLKRYSTYVEKMTPDDRANPDALIAEAQSLKRGAGSAERLERIAADANCEVADVARFVYEFNVMRGAAVKFARGESPESIKASMQEEQEDLNAPTNRAQRRAKKRKKVGAIKGRGGGGGFR